MQRQCKGTFACPVCHRSRRQGRGAITFMHVGVCAHMEEGRSSGLFGWPPGRDMGGRLRNRGGRLLGGYILELSSFELFQ